MATKTTILALASAAAALATAASAVAEELSGGEGSTVAPEKTETETPTSGRGRGRKPAAAAEEEPADKKGGAVPSFEELRELIGPLVKGGQGDEVKKIIAKYAPAETPILKEIPDDKKAAFVKDIEALSY